MIIKKNLSLTPIIEKKLRTPFILVSLLFALWGFASAFTDRMVNAFKKVLELTNSRAAWIQMSFYGGYFCMAIVGGAFMPKIQGMIIDMGGAGVSDLTILGVSEINFSFILPLFSFLYIFYYGNLVSKTI